MRRPDWPERLAAEIQRAVGERFDWGRHDCCLFAARCVEAVTGRDFAAEFRGRYASRREARAVLAEAGGVEAIARRAAGLAGWAEVPPLAAQRGDLVLIDTGEGPALGIANGARIVAAGVVGLAALPLGAGKAAWRVG